ncbi:hypothetical protein BTR14_03140 [Rhizobium rhizosphaerae]|uniref:DUF2530 domain-containing protein n=1 Tax=Xaviernesmea rhizosphaerae TaxID=1672749 RepID=A0ABX3PGB9_9HYPH|nr:hypothetical protein BTR14_03140 [Xaviernesmea rhizosphaerae]
MPTIDHDPQERRPEGPWPWLGFWALVGLLWAGYLTLYTPNWLALMLGFGTGMMFATWAIDISGNRSPFSRKDRAPD